MIWRSYLEMSEADFVLYWAMVNDQIIERDPEIEKQYQEWLASTSK